MASTASRARTAELLQDVADQVCEALTECGVLSAAATSAGQAVAAHLAAQWGGQLIYFPKGMASIVQEKRRQIVQEFTGNNHAELARKHGVSVTHVYAILREARAERKAAKRPN